MKEPLVKVEGLRRRRTFKSSIEAAIALRVRRDTTQVTVGVLLRARRDTAPVTVGGVTAGQAGYNSGNCSGCHCGPGVTQLR